MTPVDIITAFINSVLSQQLFISSLVVGYPMFFFFFYHSPFWDRISFGERLAFGFGIGVPFSIFTGYFSNVVASIASFLNFGYDFFTLWALVDAGFILAFALLRASIGEPLRSPKGYDWVKDRFEGTKIFYSYMIFPFLFALFLLFPHTDPTASIASIDFIGQIIVELLILILVTWLFILVPLSFLFCAPDMDKSVELIGASLTYLTGINYLTPFLREGYNSLNQQLSDLGRRINQAQYTRKTKTLFAIFLLIIVIFVLVADSSEPIFSPRLVGEVTSYGSQPIQVNLYQYSPSQDEYWVILPVQTTFLFQPALWPIFDTDIANPGNYSQSEYQECVTGISPYGVQSAIPSGGINDTLLCSNSILTGFQIMPLWNHTQRLAQLVVSAYDNLTFATVSVSKLSMVRNFTNVDGSQTQVFQFSIANGFPYSLLVNNFQVQGLPQVNRTSASSFCMCPGNNTVDLSNSVGTQQIYAEEFYVQPKTLANVTVTITFEGSNP